VDTNRRRDRGTILPITLVIVVVLGAVVVALANYASSTLRYGRVVEQSADRLATADGALDNVLEAIDRNASLCTLTPLASQPGGYTFSLLTGGDTINDIVPTVTCRALGGDVTGVEEYALVLTGDPGIGTRVDALLEARGSTTPRKVIDGPVYMAQPPSQSVPSLTLSAPLTIQNGDLWYSKPSCPDGPDPDVSVTMYPSGTQNLLITPAGYGFRCIEAPNWQSLFQAARPSEAAVSSLAAAPAPTPDTDGCLVWKPGRYVGPSSIAPLSTSDYHYFESGNYYFENVGDFNVTDSFVLFGAPGDTGPSIPAHHPDALADNKCQVAWGNDPDEGGATVFVGGDSRFSVDANGALEISGRSQGGRLVSLHALETTAVPSDRHGDFGGTSGSPRLVRVSSGGNKEIAFEGLVWAPYGSFLLDNVSNDAVAALTGGAVISEIIFQAPASATNLVIGAGGTAGPRQLEITSSATSPDGGTTRSRTVITYDSGDYALESRRVMCLTPGDSGTGC
jgi:hypothetical protein